MEDWLFYLLTVFLSLSLTSLLFPLKPSRTSSPPLPPGPVSIPILSPILSLARSNFDLEPLLRKLKKTHGPIISLKFFSRPAIFITDRSVAHRALIQLGAHFSDRPTANSASRLLSANQRNISSSTYGPTWRALRRNLTAEVLHPTRVRAFGTARKWVLEILIERFKEKRDEKGVAVMENFQYAMFCLLVFMCFGVKMDELKIIEIESVQRELVSYFVKSQVFIFYPKITKIIFRKRWNKIISLRKKQEEIFLPLIKSRKEKKEDQNESIFSYADSLLDLKLPEDGGRKLTEGEMVSLCSEFLTGGTDTTATSLQWIMANLIKNPEIQNKLWTEIKQVMGTNSQEVKEEDLQKMSYLKAVVLEALRRHPPGHFVLPHTVSEDIELNGFTIPKGAPINFTVAEIAKDESVWSDPMEFKPERFTEGGEAEGIDLTGSKEIKMMPFGAGRRICPGLGLALMHLEYFVANLVKEFEWKELEGEEVDLSETLEFTVVMKRPLRARVVPRQLM
ncbi:hypothetical protein LUZ60_011718 [Juncus effusus]|nr:hypothetical protein LUZ60_011718 [Juncus effusus]